MAVLSVPLRLHCAGTVIHTSGGPSKSVTGFATIDNCSLINVEVSKRAADNTPPHPAI